MKNLIYLIIIPLILIWLVLCGILAIAAIFVHKKQKPINLNKVHKKETVCKVLNNKNLISNKAYDYEANEVASRYDDITFQGYLLILSPVIFLLKYTNYIDTFMLYLVRKWMQIHNFEEQDKKNENRVFKILCRLSVKIAWQVGQVVNILK